MWRVAPFVVAMRKKKKQALAGQPKIGERKIGFGKLSKCLCSLIDVLGTETFYPQLGEFLGHFLGIPHHFVCRHSPRGESQFIINRSLTESLLNIHLPLLHEMEVRRTRGQTISPITYAELRRVGRDIPPSADCDGHNNPLDELVMMFEVIGDSWIVVGLIRNDRFFSSDEIDIARALHPLLSRIHARHVESSLLSAHSELSELISPVYAIFDDEQRPLLKSASWSHRINQAMERLLKDHIAAQRSGSFAIVPTMIAHWRPFTSSQHLVPNGSIVALEEKPTHYVGPGSEDWMAKFSQLYGLTARESQIVSHLLQGHTSQKIAETLRVSVGTVRNHKHRLYSKLDITTERELFVCMFELIAVSDRSAVRRTDRN